MPGITFFLELNNSELNVQNINFGSKLETQGRNRRLVSIFSTRCNNRPMAMSDLAHGKRNQDTWAVIVTISMLTYLRSNIFLAVKS